MLNQRDRFQPFHFDGNEAFGPVDSPEDWRSFVRAYRGDVALLLKAKKTISDFPGPPIFGFYSEHQGPLTLGEWANSVGMDLVKMANGT